MDKALKIKLCIVGAIFAIFAYHHDKILFLEPHILSHYPLISVVITGISLGMILSVMVYNLSIYVYSRERQYLYYALAQLSVFGFLITLESLYIAPFNLIYGIESLRWHAVFHPLLLIFSMLFIREFLSTREIKQLDRTIDVIILLAGIDLVLSIITAQNIITGLIPIFVPIWLVVSESYRLIKVKNRPFYLFYVAWNMVIVTAVMVYTELTSLIDENFPFLHIAFAIESVLLSLALTYKIKLLQDEKEASQSLLLQQSRLASMGEMVASIAHQWRQPLTHLSFLFMNIKKNSTQPEVVEKKLAEANTQLTYMSKTIEDFRNFYNPSKHKETFSIHEAIKTTLKISSQTLENAKIAIGVDLRNDFRFYGNKNEFEQVMLNLIHNARDILIARKILHPKIAIEIDAPNIWVKDNGKGVEKAVMAKVFEPYFSTKEGSDGIGLYIAKTIVEKEMGGKLSVRNDGHGAVFEIVLSVN